MRLRSLLFVPGDSERKLIKGLASGADALILDLEDSVAPPNKQAARLLVASAIESVVPRSWACFIRINDLDSGLALADLSAVVRRGVDAIVLPKSNSARDVDRVGYYLDALEEKAGLIAGSIKIVVVATETPRAMFELGTYAPKHQRLLALTWGAEDLSAVIGATSNKDHDGSWTFPYQVARAHCLFAAAAAEVAPIDTLYADFRDLAGLAADCRLARRDGFTGRIAIHPDQVDVINTCFNPSAEDVALAYRLIRAFADAGNAGTVGLDGKMYDIPHLKAARKTVEAALKDEDPAQ